jgi:hypothetical protein
MTVATTTSGTGGGTDEAAFLQLIALKTNPAAMARAAAFRNDRDIWYGFIVRIVTLLESRMRPDERRGKWIKLRY